MNCIDLMSKRLKQRKITNAIKLWSICIDLTSKLSKMLSYVSKNSKERKTTKLIKDKKNLELRRKTFKTTQNYKTDQIIMHCIDLTSKRSKLLSYVAKYKSNQITMNCNDLTFKRSKLLSDVAKLQKSSNYNELHWFDVKRIKNAELRRKTFKTTLNFQSNQITMNCIDLT